MTKIYAESPGEVASILLRLYEMTNRLLHSQRETFVLLATASVWVLRL